MVTLTFLTAPLYFHSQIHRYFQSSSFRNREPIVFVLLRFNQIQRMLDCIASGYYHWFSLGYERASC